MFQSFFNFRFCFIIGLFIVLFSFSKFHTFAANQPEYSPIILQTENPNDFLMGDFIQVWEEKEILPLDSLFKKFISGNFWSIGNQKLFNQGYTESIWWFGFSIQNISEEINKFVFSPVGAAIREGILYSFNEAGELLNTQYSGFMYGGENRDMKSRINSYQVSFEPGETIHFLLKLDSRGLNTYIPFYLDTINYYWEYETYRTAVYATVAGILIMATIIALFFWLYFKENMYLTFSAYVTSCLVLILEEDGFLHLWFYGEKFGILSAIIIPLFSLLMSFFLLLFIHQFFDLNVQNNPKFKWTRVYLIFLVSFALTIFSSLLFQEKYSFNRYLNWSALILAFLNMVLVLWLTIAQHRNQGKLAYFFIGATAILIFGFSNYVLNLQGLINWHPLKPNGLIFGSIINVVAFTIGLTHRYYEIRKEKERLVQEKIENERELARSIIEAQERERQRIAKDLHDDMGGLLSMIKLKLDSILMEYSGDENSRTSLEETHKLMGIACQDLRFIAHELMPMEASEKRLKTMVSEVLDLVKAQNKLKITYDIGEIPFLHIDTKINLFRIIKELLNNIIKHAEATEADIQVFFDDFDESITLMVTDNGKGIPESILSDLSQGMGLRNLQKRVEYLKGNIHFDINKNGTTIIVTIPFIPKDQAHE